MERSVLLCQTYKMKLKLLIITCCCLVFFSCKKIIINAIAKEFVPMLWEDRAEGIECTSTISSNTFEREELSFNTNHMHCINITMDISDFDQLRSESRVGPNIYDNNGQVTTAALLEYVSQCDVPMPSYYNWYTSNITIDGITLNNVGIRKKGFLGSLFSSAPSIKINTSKYTDQMIGLTNNITFNNNAEDESRVVQTLNYKLFELIDYPAPRCNLSNIKVNDEALGTYCHLEAVDQYFLQQNFGNSNGDLYEGQLVDFIAEWLPRWEVKNDITDPSRAPILKISEVLASYEGESLLTELDKYLNLEHFYTFWAMEIILDHNDGYCRNRNNFFIYFDPNDADRAIFIPWGLNYMRPDESDSWSGYVSAELPRKLASIATSRTALENELNRIMDLIWDENTLISMIDEYATLAKTAEHNPNYETVVTEVKSWFINRKSSIERLINNGIPYGNLEAATTCYHEE